MPQETRAASVAQEEPKNLLLMSVLFYGYNHVQKLWFLIFPLLLVELLSIQHQNPNIFVE